MLRLSPKFTRTASPFPYPPLFRSVLAFACSLRASAAMFCNTGRSDAHVDTRSDCTACGPRRRPGSKQKRSLAGLREVTIRQKKRSEEHTSELQSLIRNSYAVFCLIKKTKH